jgi:hypothetical protein
MHLTMKKKKNLESSFIVKKCAYCNGTFYAKRNTGTYCSDTCKVKFSKRKTTTQQWYAQDPNEGKKLPPGTITSWEMPEDKLLLRGSKASIIAKLTDLVSEEQLIEEKEFIEKAKPYFASSDWNESVVQIFTDENFIEVFRIFPDDYKLYVWPWLGGIPFQLDITPK